MKTLKDIKARAHSLLEAHLDKHSQCLMKPPGFMTEWEMSQFLIGLEEVGEDIFDFKDESDHEDSSPPATKEDMLTMIHEIKEMLSEENGGSDE